jgi:formate hydrogenlyase subunit 3/multisubunit Na+/H+ antiporter MnhD subunit
MTLVSTATTGLLAGGTSLSFACLLQSEQKNANTPQPSSFLIQLEAQFSSFGGAGIGLLRRWRTNFEFTALMAKDFPEKFPVALLCGLLIAFGVKLPIVPLHTWLPDAHGEATAQVHRVAGRDPANNTLTNCGMYLVQVHLATSKCNSFEHVA